MPNTTVSPTSSYSPLLVYTRWVLDASVVNGPEPGYRPALTGLTGHDVQAASAKIDSLGTCCIIEVSFTSRGSDLFKQLTRDNVAACSSQSGAGSTCAGRHLGIWLDLAQTDIDNWADPSYVARVSQIFDMGCLAHKTSTTVCPKFVTDPVTLQEIDGGRAIIAGAFTPQRAHDLANAINSTSRA